MDCWQRGGRQVRREDNPGVLWHQETSQELVPQRLRIPLLFLHFLHVQTLPTVLFTIRLLCAMVVNLFTGDINNCADDVQEEQRTEDGSGIMRNRTYRISIDGTNQSKCLLTCTKSPRGWSKSRRGALIFYCETRVGVVVPTGRDRKTSVS